MEYFEKAKFVRLSNCHGKYLWANSDKQTVSQSRKGDEANAIWEVRRVTVDNKERLRFRSCYKCYLTGSHTPFLLGMTGKKVVQTNPTKSDDLSDWIPEEFGSLIMLKTRVGSLLRANGGPPPWRGTVTHDVPIPLVTGSFDVYWAVEIIETDM